VGVDVATTILNEQQNSKSAEHIKYSQVKNNTKRTTRRKFYPHINNNFPPLDPSTATRADFTSGYSTNVPPRPPNADPKWTRLFAAAIALFKALGEDETMARNNL
jgi:hypothetical protein